MLASQEESGSLDGGSGDSDYEESEEEQDSEDEQDEQGEGLSNGLLSETVRPQPQSLKSPGTSMLWLEVEDQEAKTSIPSQF